VSEKEATVF